MTLLNWLFVQLIICLVGILIRWFLANWLFVQLTTCSVTILFTWVLANWLFVQKFHLFNWYYVWPTCHRMHVTSCFPLGTRAFHMNNLQAWYIPLQPGRCKWSRGRPWREWKRLPRWGWSWLRRRGAGRCRWPPRSSSASLWIGEEENITIYISYF